MMTEPQLAYYAARENQVVTASIAAKRQAAGIKFTHRPKTSIFTPQGRLVAPIHVKFIAPNFT